MLVVPRVLELEAYRRATIRLVSPVLDLACGDGRVVGMLRQLRLIDDPPCGVDNYEPRVRQASREAFHANVVCSDATRLPYRDGSFASIVCNAALCAIDGGPDPALREIRRLLQTGGQLMVTVPTDRFIGNVSWLPWLWRLSPRLGEAYVHRLNQRLTHFTTWPVANWQAALARHGLVTDHTEEFFGPRMARLWSILALQVFRACALLKPLGPAPRRVAIAPLRRIVAKAARADRDSGGPFGYVLLAAHKVS